MEEDLKNVLISEQQLKKKVEELGKKISKDYHGRELILVGILKGAVMFYADLARCIDMPLVMDFMVVSSYGNGTESSGAVRILKDLETSIEGKHVLIIEDIVDTGLTLHYLKENLLARGPASVKICSFLDKPDRREIPVEIDYKGFEISDEFVVGYGLDYAEKYRNLPYISVLKPEVYE
ncbi:MAG: hypoxanthine phosphoribosyltransferase [Clostridia bacterium]|nr:hypoxanthine phosphoribosyltransferase [Clostridia bacterium]